MLTSGAVDPISALEVPLIAMAWFAWKEKYSVGHEEIDKQHRKLIEIVNLLHENMMAGSPPEGLMAVLDRLVTYVREHFCYEESVMERCKYPDLAEHRRKHLAIVSQVQNFQIEARQGKVTVSIKLMNFLKDWLDKHIMDTDMKYSSYVGVLKG